jgi:hypothetical protein
VTDDADDLDRRLARLFEAGRREEPEDHPAPEKLSAYQANELPPEEADAIQEHLVQCAFCTDLFLDLERFLEPEEEEGAREGVADLVAEAGWRKVRAEMGWVGRAAEPAAEVSRLRRSLRVFQRLAAIFLVGIVGLSMYAVRLRQEIRTDETPVSVSLINQIGPRSVEEETDTLEASPGDSIVFTLYALPELSGDFQVEIHDENGKTFWSRSGLMKRGDYLAFRVPPKVLEPGLYEIRALAKGHIVGEYSVKIVPPAR